MGRPFRRRPPQNKRVSLPKYTFVIVYREEWPEAPTKSFLRKLIRMKIREVDDAFPSTWFFDVPKLPGTKIFRVYKGEISLCCTVLSNESLRLPNKSLSISMKPTQV